VEGFWGSFYCLGGKKGRWNGVQKDHIISQYSVQQESQQLFATKYLPYLPTEAELVAEIEREKLVIREWFVGGIGFGWGF
jgi:hypothetical protein